MNHFSGKRFCDNTGLREEGSSPSCMSKDRTLDACTKRKERKDEVGTAELLQNEEHLTHFLFQPEKILLEEIFPNPSHANSSYG